MKEKRKKLLEMEIAVAELCTDYDTAYRIRHLDSSENYIWAFMVIGDNRIKISISVYAEKESRIDIEYSGKASWNIYNKNFDAVSVEEFKEVIEDLISDFFGA